MTKAGESEYISSNGCGQQIKIAELLINRQFKPVISYTPTSVDVHNCGAAKWPMEGGICSCWLPHENDHNMKIINNRPVPTDPIVRKCIICIATRNTFTLWTQR